METKHTKLTGKERDFIALWKNQEVSLREISRRLCRSPSTIHDEIARNSFWDHEIHTSYYVALHAHYEAGLRRRRSAVNALKNPKVYTYVMKGLSRGWSPEQIAGRLRKKCGETVICHETIYRFIYDKKHQEKKLWEYLPCKRMVRRKKHGRKVHKSHILFRVSIHNRPEVVNRRLVFGHWEGDTVEGKRSVRDGLHTEVERVSRFTIACKVKAITGTQTAQAQQKLFTSLASHLRRSTTLDNGSENHLHYRLYSLGMDTYFADPYSAWQRGTNEYHNGLIRRYLPKGTDFTTLTQEELDDILEEINDRPRKVLNYNTPKEVFTAYLNRGCSD